MLAVVVVLVVLVGMNNRKGRLMRNRFVLAFLLGWASIASAEPKSDEFLESVARAANLDAHRDDVEKKLAAEQVRVYRLTQEVERLKKQLAELKKAAEEKKAD